MILGNNVIEDRNRQFRKVCHLQMLDDIPVVAPTQHGASEPSAEESVHVAPQSGLGDLRSK